MTAYVTLRCEVEQNEPGGDDIGVCCSLVVAPGGADAAAARAYAAGLGWSTDASGRDLCGCQQPRRVVRLEYPDAE
ncbi:hypothetical protein AB0F17_28555 [Nonomuraea sp. NPDC026600]|uniref:hypothetical protein n=1 Tax=Nonomuraea sp. NPDC026600 TaxID=3155363 RepID=UPI0034004D7E